MKTKYFVIISSIAVLIFQICCVDERGLLTASNNDSVITRFDAEEMAKKNLVDFTLVRERAQWNRGREFVYQKLNDQVNVFITIGLHQSSNDAKDIALDYLNEISMGMREGPLAGVAIGDKLWWLSPNSDSNNVTDILFTRKNALFIMSSHSYIKLKELAKAIDEDIVKGESYLTIENSILLPKINSISVEKSNLQVGESIKITVNATDSRNELLEYQSQPGLIKIESDPENVFTLTAIRDLVPEPFIGSHTIKFVVINKSNVVSRLSEITVNITP